MSVYDKIETDNPLLDEIVYSCKLIMKSCIVKDEEQASLKETLESEKNFDIYEAIQRGTATIDMFNPSIADMQSLDFPQECIDLYISNNYSIPSNFPATPLKRLLDKKIEEFLSTYEEMNNYYRKFLGLPDYGEDGLYITAEDIEGTYSDIDITKPIHEFTLVQKNLLASLGIIDRLKEQNPKAFYLKHFVKNIDSYKARKAENFELLYVDESIESTLSNKFKELYAKNRLYIMKTMMVDSYKYYSNYYNKVIMLIIVSQTVIDMISELPNYIIRRDVFDIRTCQYFFEANGIEFNKDIPIKYQKKLIQNFNKLLQYCSTKKNVKDICKIFGYEDANIYKYYLMKIHKTDVNGIYIVPDENNLENAYDLKFVKVPIDGSVDDCYRNDSNIQDYNSVIMDDKYWDGPYDTSYVKNEILKKDFNIVQSKYISIDALYSLTDTAFQAAYFYNMLYFSGIDSKSVGLIIPVINQNIKLPFIDIMSYLFALTYIHNGVEDVIVTIPSQVLKVKGFNFSVDLTSLSAYIAEKGYTLEELGVSGFNIPQNGILTMKQMIDIYINNRDIYNKVVHQMHRADSKAIYDCYKKIYESLMISEINTSLFFISALDRTANSYSEYLKYSNPIIYTQLSSIEKMPDSAEKKEYICNLMTNITNSLIEWIDTDDISGIFSDFPIDNANYAEIYIRKILEFFKSYKIEVLAFQSKYKVDDERVFIIDNLVGIDLSNEYEDYIKAFDKLKSMYMDFSTKDRVVINDLVEIRETYTNV